MDFLISDELIQPRKYRQCITGAGKLLKTTPGLLSPLSLSQYNSHTALHHSSAPRWKMKAWRELVIKNGIDIKSTGREGERGNKDDSFGSLEEEL